MKLLITTQKMDKNDPILGFFHNWILEFSKHFEKVTVIALGVGEYELPKNVEVYSLGKEEGTSKIKYIFNFHKILLKKRGEYDSVFVHMNPEYLLLGGIFWRLKGIKTALWYTHKSVDLKLKLAEKLVDKIFTASKKSFRLKSRKVEIVGHGINLNSYGGATSVSSVGHATSDWLVKCISIGRISPSKNYEVMIEAVKILNEKGVNANLKIIGAPATLADEDYLEKIKTKISKEGLEDSVELAGPISHEKIEKEIDQADIFLNTSRTGSLDKAVLEAMATGALVITSNEAFYELAQINENLFLKKEEETSEKIAENIENILKMSQDEKRVISEKLKTEVSEKHSLETLIKRIVSFYKNE